MTTGDDRSWDLDVSDGGAFDRKIEEGRRRDWMKWLTDELRFPFEVTRTEDMEANPFDPPRGPFAVGRRLRAIGLAEEHWKLGILVMVVAGSERGVIPLADVEVSSDEDPNYWPVREHVVWAANH